MKVVASDRARRPNVLRHILLIYANNEPKSALARDLGDCRDNKGKLAKRVFTCLQEIPMELPVKKMDTNGTQNTYSKIVRQEIGL